MDIHHLSSVITSLALSLTKVTGVMVRTDMVGNNITERFFNGGNMSLLENETVQHSQPSFLFLIDAIIQIKRSDFNSLSHYVLQFLKFLNKMSPA